MAQLNSLIVTGPSRFLNKLMATEIQATQLNVADKLSVTSSAFTYNNRKVMTGSSVGNSTTPVYIDANGYPVAISSYGGTAAVANKLGTATVGSGSRPIYLNSGTPTQIDLTLLNVNTSMATGGWKAIGGRNNNIASISVTKPTTVATGGWNTQAHAAGIGFGTGDTKGYLECAYNNPLITLAGGNSGGSTDDNPVWWFKLKGTSSNTYTFPSTSKTLCASDGTNASGTWGISITGNATKANYLNLYEARGTTTTLNKSANYVAAGAMFHLIASSSTNSAENGKTPDDANILQMNWDNSGGYDSQMGISTSSNRMFYRSMSSQKTAWREVASIAASTQTGSATKGVYVSNTGVITAMTYALNATINAGAANKLAYYSGANAISQYTSTVGTATKGIYMNAGWPTAMTYELKATLNNATQWGVAYYSTATNVTSTAAGTAGYLLQGNGAAAPSWIQATNTNTANTIVKRDGSGNFSAGTITASLNGNAATASKWLNARNITLAEDLQGVVTIDGSKNVTLNARNYSCSVGSGNKSNYPWHRIATTGMVTSSYNHKEMIIAIRHSYDGGGYGVAKIALKTNNVSNGNVANASIKWLYRYNISVDALQIGLKNTSGDSLADLYYKVGTYARCIIYQLQGSRSWTLINSTEVNNTTTTDKKTSTECYASISDAATELGITYTNTIIASDGATVQTANYANKANGDTTTIRSSYIRKIKQVTSNGTTFTFRGEFGDGSNANDLITIPTASTTVAGLITNAAQTIAGDKTLVAKLLIENAGTSSANKSSAFRISSSESGAGTDIGMEFWRGTNASWQIVNSGDNLYFKTNYTGSTTNSYSLEALKLNHTTGAARVPYLGINEENTDYRLYVNGTSYFNSNTTHNGIDYFANGTTYYINNSADAVLRHGSFRGTSDSNTAAGSYFTTGAIEIRESNCVGNTQSSFAYAPRIGFHWGSRIAASLSFHSDGIFYLRKQNGSDRASLDANLVGNAATATGSNALRESQQNHVVMTTFLDNNANIHRSNLQGELNLYRFYAGGDAANYSTTYGYPAVDNHTLVFSIDGGNDWERVIDLDIRSTNIYTRAKTSGTWGSWATLLTTDNYTGILDGRYVNVTGDTMTGTINSMDIIPKADNTYTLGTSTNRWKEIFGYIFTASTKLQAGSSYLNSSNDLYIARSVGIKVAPDTNYALKVTDNSYFNGHLILADNKFIRRSGHSVSWIYGRDGAILRQTTYTGYNPIISAKTTDGDWSFGPSGSNIMYLTYCTDANYNAGTNTTTAQFLFKPDGTMYIGSNKVLDSSMFSLSGTTLTITI